jgi:hypothetical protein
MVYFAATGHHIAERPRGSDSTYLAADRAGE